MKKQVLIIANIFIAAAVLFTSCKKDGNNRPVITLKGNSFEYVYFKTVYKDEGAIAIDEEDGDITSSIVTTNTVNTDSAEGFEVRYNVFDSDGNAAISIERYVAVIFQNSDLTDSYTVTSKINNDSSIYLTSIIEIGDSLYIQNLTDGGVNNEGAKASIYISKNQANMIFIPEQTITYNYPQQTTSYFHGYGQISPDGNTIDVSYTKTTNGIMDIVNQKYVRN